MKITYFSAKYLEVSTRVYITIMKHIQNMELTSVGVLHNKTYYSYKGLDKILI
jgi:hypothetical protein